MKYRHSYHAGNFADVHKHVTLLALLRALQRKDKGFLYLDTHAGRGAYDQSSPSPEAAAGIGRLSGARPVAPELREFEALLAAWHARPGQRHVYPGSPLIAALTLRAQDRAVLIELQAAEAHALERALGAAAPGVAAAQTAPRVERGDGYQRLRAFLPPPERRALVLIDPPYEEAQEPARVAAALAEALQRFPNGVLCAWYPIKDARSSAAWLRGCAQTLRAPLLVSELWVYARDSRVGLNGSGLLIANPPYLTLEGMQTWLPELRALLAVTADAGARAQMLSESAA